MSSPLVPTAVSLMKPVLGARGAASLNPVLEPVFRSRSPVATLQGLGHGTSIGRVPTARRAWEARSRPANRRRE
jgi:hypothetical protein